MDLLSRCLFLVRDYTCAQCPSVSTRSDSASHLPAAHRLAPQLDLSSETISLGAHASESSGSYASLSLELLITDIHIPAQRFFGGKVCSGQRKILVWRLKGAGHVDIGHHLFPVHFEW